MKTCPACNRPHSGIGGLCVDCFGDSGPSDRTVSPVAGPKGVVIPTRVKSLFSTRRRSILDARLRQE